MFMKVNVFLLAASVILTACGGGDAESPSAPPSAASAPRSVVAEPVVPTLIGGVYGRKLFALKNTGGGFEALPFPDCRVPFGAAVNPTTGLVEIFCPTGATYRYNTSTGAVHPGPQLGRAASDHPSVTCLSNGRCIYGHGMWNPLPSHPSNAAISIVEGDGTVKHVPLPDQIYNAIPIAMGMVDGNGYGSVLAVLTRMMGTDRYAIHIMRVDTGRFVGECTFRAEVTHTDLSHGSVTLGVQRVYHNDTSPDVVVVDPVTCARTQEIRLPIPGNGTGHVGFLAKGANVLVVGEGTATPNTSFGVWVYDQGTGEVRSGLALTSRPFAGAYEKDNVLHVGTWDNVIRSIDLATSVVLRETPWVTSEVGLWGQIFLAE
jgi:hypothetical protein